MELWWRFNSSEGFPFVKHVWFDARTEQPMAWADANDAPDDSRTGQIWIVERAGIVDSTSSTDLVTSFVPPTNEAPPIPDWLDLTAGIRSPEGGPDGPARLPGIFVP